MHVTGDLLRYNYTMRDLLVLAISWDPAGSHAVAGGARRPLITSYLSMFD